MLALLDELTDGHSVPLLLGFVVTIVFFLKFGS